MKFEKILDNLNYSPKQKAFVHFYNLLAHKNISEYSSEREYLFDGKTFFEEHELQRIMHFRDNYEYEEFLVWKSIISHMGLIDMAAQCDYFKTITYIQEHKALIQKLISKKEIVDIENEKYLSFSSNKEHSLTEIFELIGINALNFYSHIILLLVMDEIFDNYFSELNIFESTKKLDVISKYNEGLDETDINPVLEYFKNMYITEKKLLFKTAKIDFRHLTYPLSSYKIVFGMFDLEHILDRVDRVILNRLSTNERDIMTLNN